MVDSNRISSSLSSPSASSSSSASSSTYTPSLYSTITTATSSSAPPLEADDTLPTPPGSLKIRFTDSAGHPRQVMYPGPSIACVQLVNLIRSLDPEGDTISVLQHDPQDGFEYHLHCDNLASHSIILQGPLLMVTVTKRPSRVMDMLHWVMNPIPVRRLAQLALIRMLFGNFVAGVSALAYGSYFFKHHHHQIVDADLHVHPH